MYSFLEYDPVPEPRTAADEITEQTILLTHVLPPGVDYRWIADCNVVVLSAGLDAAGRQRAIDDLQAQWRKRWLSPVA